MDDEGGMARICLMARVDDCNPSSERCSRAFELHLELPVVSRDLL
jgi:hypothetical protein